MLIHLLMLLYFIHTCRQDEIRVTEEEIEKKLSEKILTILEHYKNDDPVGLPGAPILDPMPIPPLRQSHPVATLNFKNASLYGLSKFKLKSVETDLIKMNVHLVLKIDTLDVRGMYSMSSWFTRSSGAFYVKLTNVTTNVFTNLTVELDGKLQAQDMNIDIIAEDIAMDFENLNFLGSVFQGIINSVGNFIFNSVKPFITKDINNNMRGDINKQMANIPKKFPSSIPPFDLVIFEIRKKFRKFSVDPLIINDYNYSVGLVGLELSRTVVQGLTTFYRQGNVTFNISDHVMYFGMDMTTQMITGTNEWNVIFGTHFISKNGYLTFTIDHVNVKMTLSQSMDVRNHPTIEDIQLEIGNIQIRCDGAGTIDYFVEFAVNIVPNLLRYQIMDALENPVKEKIQEALNTIHIEDVIHEKAEDIDRIKQHGFDIDYFFDQLNQSLH